MGSWRNVVHEIKGNEKRMAKLAALDGMKRREKAKCYVVAEARRMKERLSEDDIRHAVIAIVG